MADGERWVRRLGMSEEKRKGNRTTRCEGGRTPDTYCTFPHLSEFWKLNFEWPSPRTSQ